MDESILLTRINALAQFDDKSDLHVLKARNNHPRSYIAWDSEEDQLLIEMHQAAFTSSRIADLLKRSKGAIDSRIKFLGLANQVESCSDEQQLVKEDVNKISALNLIRYWRNSLADEDKMGLSPKKLKKGEQFPLDTFREGRLPTQRIKRFFEAAEREIRQKNKKRYKYNTNIPDEEDSVIIKQLQVIIASYTAIKDHEHGKATGSRKKSK